VGLGLGLCFYCAGGQDLSADEELVAVGEPRAPRGGWGERARGAGRWGHLEG
jgi:hypothetical protein